MLSMTDRYVVVEAHALDDLCELAGRAASAIERASTNDPLGLALRGAVAQVRTNATVEPDRW